MAEEKPIRVAVWSTGGIGSIAIHALRRRPDLDLVGVWVHSPEKEGKDAGELADGVPLGLAATNDEEAILAADPQCIVYVAQGPGGDAAAVADYVRFLERGIDVVSTTATMGVYPPAYPFVDQVRAAADAGKATFYSSGIEPGFAADQLPLLLATQSASITSIRATEIGLYDDYPVHDVMFDTMGFGRPLDFQPLLGMPEAIKFAWSGPVRMMADAMDLELDEIVERFDRRPTDRRLEVASGVIEPGTCGAIRTECIGMAGGREAVVVEHVNRMALDIAPEWASVEGGVAYRIQITGEPNMTCTLHHDADGAAVGVPGMVAGAGAMVATAMRAVNAVPYVVAAAPGYVSSLDLPLTVPRHAFDLG